MIDKRKTLRDGVLTSLGFIKHTQSPDGFVCAVATRLEQSTAKDRLGQLPIPLRKKGDREVLLFRHPNGSFIERSIVQALAESAQ